jgi:hypothetical protein
VSDMMLRKLSQGGHLVWTRVKGITTREVIKYELINVAELNY